MGYRRPLHWVVKSTSLENTLNFYADFGMKVFRHEEFDSGCEATCKVIRSLVPLSHLNYSVFTLQVTVRIRELGVKP